MNIKFKIDKFWFFINAIAAFILMLFFYFCFKIINRENPEKNLKTTIATITKIKSGGRISHEVEYTFSSNNVEYTTNSNPIKNPIMGEKYIVEFDSLNPNKCKIRADKPVFLSHEVTKYTIGYLDVLNTNFFTSLSFTYYIDGKKFTKSYEPESGIAKRYPNFKERKKYIVKYWVENPERAIILPDQPTNLPLDYKGLIKFN